MLFFYQENMFFMRIGAAWRMHAKCLSEEILIVMWPYECYFRHLEEASVERIKRCQFRWRFLPWFIFSFLPVNPLIIAFSLIIRRVFCVNLRKSGTRVVFTGENRIRFVQRTTNRKRSKRNLKIKTLFSSLVLELTDDDLPIRPILNSVKNRSGWKPRNKRMNNSV